jgi:hypothetical protein
MSAPLTRTQRLVAGIALLRGCASFTGARSGRGSPAADDEHRWHKGPVGPSTATPLSPLLPPAQAASQFKPTRTGDPDVQVLFAPHCTRRRHPVAD